MIQGGHPVSSQGHFPPRFRERGVMCERSLFSILYTIIFVIFRRISGNSVLSWGSWYYIIRLLYFVAGGDAGIEKAMQYWRSSKCRHIQNMRKDHFSRIVSVLYNSNSHPKKQTYDAQALVLACIVLCGDIMVTLW